MSPIEWKGYPCNLTELVKKMDSGEIDLGDGPFAEELRRREAAEPGRWALMLGNGEKGILVEQAEIEVWKARVREQSEEAMRFFLKVLGPRALDPFDGESDSRPTIRINGEVMGKVESVSMGPALPDSIPEVQGVNPGPMPLMLTGTFRLR